MNNTNALIILNAVPGFGNVRIKHLMKKFASASDILTTDDETLRVMGGLSAKLILALRQFPQEQFLKEELKRIQSHNVQVITVQDNQYSRALLEIPDAPVVLYTKGNQDLLSGYALSIVGSRRCSIYGINTANSFARQLSERGWIVVSGMARGIDTAAHKGAMEAQGETIAVLGSGLADIYPRENTILSKDICEKGLMISEFPMMTPPHAFNFPRRNRIVSGLSKGVIVIEAGEKSGASITVDCALEQGRDVFAVPGNVDCSTSRGVHKMIQQGAKLVTCVDDILEEYEMDMQEQMDQEDSVESTKYDLSQLSSDEQHLFNTIGPRPIHIDEINNQCQTRMSNTSAVLMKLELKKFIKQLPGNMFVR